MPARTWAAFEAMLPTVDHVIVDLTARTYDGVAAVSLAHEARLPVIAVGQHDDAALRRRALAVGADRVHSYRHLFEDGPRQLAIWLATPVTATLPPR